MAHAISVHTTIESESLRIPELLPFLGKKVQIIVVAEEEPVPPESTRVRPAETAGAPEASRKRTLGSLRGLLTVPEDFDAPLPEELQRAFEGEASE
jgi:hypothetical protein